MPPKRKHRKKQKDRKDRILSKWFRCREARIRQCLYCRKVFASYGAENHVCNPCQRKEIETRARPYIIDYDQRRIAEDLLNSFDEEYLNRTRENRRWLDQQRRMRQQRNRQNSPLVSQ